MWKRGGQYAGKMRRVLALTGVVIWFGLFFVVTDIALDKRVISNYFGNIAFAYEDYGFPYCFMSSVFNTGISQPNGYSEEMIAQISENGAIHFQRSERFLRNIRQGISKCHRWELERPTQSLKF